jgi:hypothetical protein
LKAGGGVVRTDMELSPNVRMRAQPIDPSLNLLRMSAGKQPPFWLP